MSRAKINKAAKIREMFEKLGQGARPRDVIAGLADEKIEVSSAQVSNIKATLGGGGKKGSSGGISIEHLVLAKKFADQLGSVERAEGALAALAKLR
jgi:hypothetical protein